MDSEDGSMGVNRLDGLGAVLISLGTNSCFNLRTPEFLREYSFGTVTVFWCSQVYNLKTKKKTNYVGYAFYTPLDGRT